MTTATMAASADEPLFAPGRRAACLGAVTLVSLLAFEAMAVAAAMPAVAAALGDDSLYALAFGGMLAASVLGMVASGQLCDRRGARPAAAIGLAVFTAGLLVAGLAGSMATVAAGRVLQGLGSGMLGVALYVGTGQIVPKALHPRLFALFAAAWVVPGLVGPPIAALLVGQFGWRSVFLGVALVVPVAAALLLPALQSATASSATPAASPRALAWASLGALGALLLNAAASLGSMATTLAALLAGSVVALVAARSLLPRGSLWAGRGLPAVIALRGLLAAGFGTAEAFVPLYLNRAHGWTLGEAGLALSTGAVCWSAGSALQARLQGDATRQRGLFAGLALVATGITIAGLPALLPVHAGVLVGGWAIAGFGIGLSFPMLSVLTLQLSAAHEQGRNASALQLADALCSSAALALAGVLFAHGGGFLAVMLLAAALPALAALLARRPFAA
jgi:MFS family permease